MKKRFLSLFLIFLSVFVFVACGETTEGQITETETTQEILTDEAPVFSGVGNFKVYQDSEIDPLVGITVEDDLDGDITDSIVITDDGDYDASIPGEYTFNISVTDSSNKTTTESFVITVVNEGPVFRGVKDLVVEFDSETDLLSNIVAKDLTDGDLTSSIVLVDDDDFDSTIPGEYNIVISVSDSLDNTTTETFVVTVEDEAPVIIGAIDKEVSFDAEHTILTGITADDDYDGDLTSEIEIINDGGYDHTIPGEYEIILSVSDSGSKTTNVEFVITVINEDAPSFSGVEDIAIDLNEDYTLLEGITATDVLDGDLTSSIVIIDDSEFDSSIAGVYPITISVTDSDELTTTKTFEIKVISENEVKALSDIDSIALNFPNLNLPKFSSNGTYFYWSSNKPTVITGSGYVINPPVGSDPVEVTLTLRAVNGSFITTKDFVFTVEPNDEVEVTDHITLPFEGTSEEYVVEDNPAVDIFYVDDGSVPYVDVKTFLNLIDGAVVSDMLSYSTLFEDVLRVKYLYTYLDIDGETEITEEYYAEIDFTENTFTVNNFDFFAGYIASTESDYGEGLNYVDADYVEGQKVVIPLGNYNFDLVTHEEGEDKYYLMPLHVANRLFAGDIYYDVYYNGDKLWGIDTFVISGGDDPDLITEIQTSSFNSENMPKDMKLATYNFFAFTMDYFYGLKPDKGYETYYEVLYAHAESLIEGADSNLYNKIFKLAYGLDDLHTSYQFDGYWENPRVPGLSISDLGPKSTAFYEGSSGIWTMQELLDAKFGSYTNIPSHSLLDDDKIAVIHITGFTIDTPDEFKEIMDSLPDTVEDVVIDLTYNTGGNVGAVMRIFGYMTEEQYFYHSQNPADGSAVTYHLESDYVAYDYNWYVMTSGVTFSAANMFASMAQELGIPVLGQKSSGGACSIGVVINPDGSAIMISTNNVLSTRVGNEIDGYEYLSVEGGVPVDYNMSDVTSDTKLIEIINEIKSSNE